MGRLPNNSRAFRTLLPVAAWPRHGARGILLRRAGSRRSPVLSTPSPDRHRAGAEQTREGERLPWSKAKQPAQQNRQG